MPIDEPTPGATLDDELSAISLENRRLLDRVAEMEQRFTELAKLHAASMRLHAPSDAAGVLTAIQEVVVNIVGCEQFTLWEIAAPGNTLALALSLGVEPPPTAPSTTVALTARTGVRYVAPDGLSGDLEAPTACIPLKLAGETRGVLSLFQLMPQKKALMPVDYQIFDLLTTQAARALEASRVLRGPGAAP
ncbi:MAG: GAF domain-containing protein [Acidobacteriota bacterium]